MRRILFGGRRRCRLRKLCSRCRILDIYEDHALIADISSERLKRARLNLLCRHKPGGSKRHDIFSIDVGKARYLAYRQIDR